MLRSLALATVLICAFTGCARGVEHWIVNTRVDQGNVALRRGSYHEAQTAYRLALRVDPRDQAARTGFSNASAAIALVDYQKGDFDDAIATIDQALKYDPQSVRLQALHSQIDAARLKREIVVSNYPTYEGAGRQIETSYAALDEENRNVLKSLKRFSYTFDTQDLTKAIELSYDLQLDLAKDTNRLIAYRQLVESGTPASAASQGSAMTESLLPLP